MYTTLKELIDKYIPDTPIVTQNRVFEVEHKEHKLVAQHKELLKGIKQLLTGSK